MLEGLDRVDWATLTHAYGSAADLPADLRALAVASTCVDAFERLTSTIYHQGSIYQATAPTVPFLAEILEGAPTLCKVHALELLSLISMGCGWHQAHKEYSILASRRDTPEFQTALKDEEVWVAEVASAVRRHHPLYLQLLTAPSRDVRIQAATLIAGINHEPSAGLDKIESAYRAEPDVVVRACYAMAMGELAAGAPRLQALLSSESAPLPRLALALRILATSAPEEAIEVVSAAMLSGELLTSYHELPNVLDFYGDLALGLLAAAPEQRWLVLEKVLQATQGQPYFVEQRSVAILLLASDGKPFDPKNLNDLQKQAIATMARLAWPKPLTTFANACQTLRAFGLPDRREQMVDYLGFDFMPAAEKSPWWKRW